MNFLKNAGTAIKSTFTSSGLEKPKYVTVNTGETEENPPFEERQYAPSKWVSTKMMAMRQEDASRKMFFMLFDYIQGKNSKGVTIDMTAPVTTRVEPGAGPNCKSTFTMSFFVPPSNSTDTPEPTNPDVFLDEWPEMSVYVRKFGGSANEEKWLAEARAHAETVTKAGKSDFHEGFYFTAGYDSPFKLFGRTNEIWFVKREATPTPQTKE